MATVKEKVSFQIKSIFICLALFMQKVAQSASQEIKTAKKIKKRKSKGPTPTILVDMNSYWSVPLLEVPPT